MPKILIVDDSLFQRKTISQMLIEAGYEVVEAKDGLDGLDKALSLNPDCILTDLLMPNMDGIEFISALKSKGSITPLFVLSADIQESKKRICLEMGVNGFLSKPPKKYELIDAIARHLPADEG